MECIPEDCQADVDEEIGSAASNGVDTEGRHWGWIVS